MNCPLVESAKHLAGVWMWLRSLEMELTLSVTHPHLVSSCLIGLICGSPCQPVLDSPPTGKLALTILLPLPGWPRGAPCSLLLVLPRPLGHEVTRTPFRDDSSLCCPGGSSPLQTLVLLAVASPGAWPGLVAVTAGEPLQSRLCPAPLGACMVGTLRVLRRLGYCLWLPSTQDLPPSFLFSVGREPKAASLPPPWVVGASRTSLRPSCGPGRWEGAGATFL